MNPAITALSLKNVRCFADEQRVKLRRVTLLVGENSAGKSTVLGCLNGLIRLANLDRLSDRLNPFDTKPFQMGLFDNVARSGQPAFRVEVEMDGDHFHRFAVEFTPGHGGALREQVLEAETQEGAPEGGRSLRISRVPGADTSRPEEWLFEGPDFKFGVSQSEVSYTQFSTWLSWAARHDQLPYGGDGTRYRMRRGPEAEGPEHADFGRFVNFFRTQFPLPKRNVLLLPLPPRGLERRRHYRHDPLAIADDPHLEAINQAGQETGLFNRINVIEDATSRYEVLVDVAGTLRNLMDVGYGVTSVLPLMIAWFKAAPTTHFLLQQPEVHVHPSAQAGIVEMMAESPHRFVIETHSDHVIDWFRIMVTEGRMAASDLAILYLERQPEDPSVTRIHEIAVDDLGNLIGAPPTYRHFFSQETSRLLGFPT